LNLRQAYISQHLMLLKQAKFVDVRRNGLNLYYRVVKPEVFTLLDTLRPVTRTGTKQSRYRPVHTDCPCPKCKVETGRKVLQVIST
jgi:ArsR family transcriptional regulator